MKAKKLIPLLVALTMVVSTFAGCGGQSNEESASSSSVSNNSEEGASADEESSDGVKRLIFSRAEDVTSFDQFNVNLLSNYMMCLQCYEGLLWLEEDGSVSPFLATEYSANEDATEWTFKLRDDVYFSNGDQLTAEDVKATYEYPKLNNLASSAQWEDLIEVEIVNDFEVIVKFSKPMGAMTYLAANNGIIHHSIIEQGPDAVQTQVLGTGPWKLQSWEPGDSVILDRNTYYWGEEPYYDEIEYKVIIEDSTRLAAVQTGQVDICEGIAPEMYETVEQDPDLNLLLVDIADQQWLGLACDKPPFNDPNVREALSLCLDRQVFVDMLGGGKVSTGIIPSRSLGGNEDFEEYEYDPERAQELLEASDYNGEPLVLLSFSGTYPKSQEQLETIQAMMTAVGFNVELEIYEMSTFAEKRAAEQYNLFWTGCAMIGLDPDSFLSARIVNNTQHCNYENQELNDAINEGRSAATIEGRQEAYEEVMTIVAENYAPFIPINETITSYITSTDIDISNSSEVFRADRLPNFRFLKPINE